MKRGATVTTFDGRYTWHGSLGCLVSSRERGVVEGDMRRVRGVNLYAYRVVRERWCHRRKVVWWVPVLRIEFADMEKLFARMRGHID